MAAFSSQQVVVQPSGSYSSSRSRCVRVMAQKSLPVRKPTLIDVPVSNHGARVRHVIYHKGLEEDFEIVSPMEFGGLGSEQYKAINPQGKVTNGHYFCGKVLVSTAQLLNLRNFAMQMPVLLLTNGTILPESEVRLVAAQLNKLKHQQQPNGTQQFGVGGKHVQW
eukprot:GHRR01022317.1.p1 GENE.GHRR01022317.1~~GHRR01022317.1.p1  ORF type:complete len:165 (+),score=51.98 GHRR01022317.1:899-1393(+)